MKWVTRERPKVDRIACPWLIKRLSITKPSSSKDDVLAAAEREGATPYDIPDAELGHHGDECSFDSIVRKYGLAKSDPALARLALIVRGADTNQRQLTPESSGLVAIAQGFSEAYADDHAQLAAELPVCEALYAWCRLQERSAWVSAAHDARTGRTGTPARACRGRIRSRRRTAIYVFLPSRCEAVVYQEVA